MRHCYLIAIRLWRILKFREKVYANFLKGNIKTKK